MNFVLRHVWFAAAALWTPLCAGDLGKCRLNRDLPVSASPWMLDGRGGLSASTDARTTGTVEWTCRLKSKEAAVGIAVRHDHVLVSFGSPEERTAGSGVRLEVSGAGVAWSSEYLRVAGENWIESGAREWTVRAEGPMREVTFKLTLVDNSRGVPVRVDIRGLAIRFIR